MVTKAWITVSKCCLDRIGFSASVSTQWSPVSRDIIKIGLYLYLLSCFSWKNSIYPRSATANIGETWMYRPFDCSLLPEMWKNKQEREHHCIEWRWMCPHHINVLEVRFISLFADGGVIWSWYDKRRWLKVIFSSVAQIFASSIG